MNDASNVLTFARRKSSLNARGAMAYLAKVAESHPESVVEVDSIAHLGTLLGWTRPRASKQLKAWQGDGKVTVDRSSTGKLIIRILPNRDHLERANTPSQSTRARRTVRARTGRATGTRAEPVKPANVVDGSDVYDTQPNSIGTQTMLEAASKNTPANVRQSTTAQQLSGPANRGIVHHTEDVNWHLAGGGTGMGGDVLSSRHAPPLVVAAYLTALILAVIAAWFSVRGMVVLFPGDPSSALALGIGLEIAKIATVGFVAASWSRLAWLFRLVLVVLAFGCETLNASGVFGQLVIAHLHKSAIAEANFERTDAEANGKIEVAQGKVADLDRRIATIDGMVDGAAQKGKSRQAANTKRDHQRERAQLVADRDQARQDLASLKTSKSGGSALHKVDEAESAPVVWAARTIGIDRDPEVITRFIIALIVICLDPLAIFLMAAVNSMSYRRWRAA
jgi:hypothetical protein